MKGLWFTELQTPELAISLRVGQVLHRQQTPYQELAVLETEALGKMLALDGIIQTTVGDEFVYHEMISLVPLNTHPHPERVLIIGGGDGGSARECVRHPRTREVTMVEIDGAVVEAAKEFLPEIGSGFDCPKLNLIIGDGIEHVRQRRDYYDVVVVDAPDPVGPAVGLFTREFYAQVHAALREDGIMVAQTESPFFNQDLVLNAYRDMRSLFPISRVYLATVPTYPGGLWTFTLGSKRYDPAEVQPETIPPLETKYYSPQMHQAAFVLPPFVKKLLDQA